MNPIEHIQSLSQMDEFAVRLLDSYPHKRVFLLNGDLGTGKTAFTQSIARAIGLQKPVTSPSFVLSVRYQVETPNLQFDTLVHADLYRLPKVDDEFFASLEEAAGNLETCLVIEWASRLAPHQVIDKAVTLSLNFTFVDETTRDVELVE